MARVVVSVRSSKEIQAAVLGLRLMDKDLRREINKATREQMNPTWQGLVKLEAQRPADFAILVPGTRIAAGNPPSAKAGTSTRKLSGGGVRADLAHIQEFGVNDREVYRTYDRRNRRTGGSHKVTRRTLRQFPARERKGRVIYPAFAELAPRMSKLWVQLVVRMTHEAFEKGSS